MVLRVTGSSLPRVLTCTGSVFLPIANTRSVEADEGTDAHDEQEKAVIVGDLSTMPADLASLIPEGATVRAEVAVAYDVATGNARELGASIGRAYGKLSPFEIPCTIDLVVTAPGFVMVADHKGHDEVDPPDKNEQVLFEALCAFKLWGQDCDEVLACVSYLPTGRVVPRTLDVFALDVFAQRLRQMQLDVAAQQGRDMPDVVESKHCKYCPSAHVCPAKRQLVQQLIAPDDLTLRDLTDDEFALAYERLHHAKRMVRRIEDQLMAMARERPRPLRNGNLLGVHRKLGNERLDGDTVYAVLRERFGVELAEAAVERIATKKQLEQALKDSGMGAVSKTRDAVLAEVRKRGGATRKESVDVAEYPPERALEDGDAA